MKKRIAVWVYGGIGTGHFSQGYPMLEKLLERLSERFELVVYSQSAPHPDFHSCFFSVRSAPSRIKATTTRWLCLIKYFTQDHRREKFQLLFGFWGYPTGVLVTVLGKLTRLPSVVYLLGSDSAGIPSINFGILHKPLIKTVVKWAYLKTSMLLAISGFQKASLASYGINRPMHIIPWGTDPSMYSYLPKITQQVLHVIHVGHLTPVKDQTTLLRAFAILAKKRPAELRIFGVDCLTGQMQRMCQELEIEKQVQFRDMVPYHEMPQQYAWADIMFHTSLSEGQSMALTEAAASGVLLAGTRVGLLYDLGDEYGITIEAGDFKGLADKVEDVLTDREDWKNKIQSARKWSESHDLSWTVDELTKVLETL